MNTMKPAPISIQWTKEELIEFVDQQAQAGTPEESILQDLEDMGLSELDRQAILNRGIAQYKSRLLREMRSRIRFGSLVVVGVALLFLISEGIEPAQFFRVNSEMLIAFQGIGAYGCYLVITGIFFSAKIKRKS
ncbi:hypothetical protein [Pontibacter sp. G13]|uniref:hypothetical protein n=1 Tax=Pontibacter sp. G13 TaxID=3074898 RepID=UPI00288B7799|nr:hypothetical protein [Pontibacter sp. G13]WNJ17624.1 hypothetical protein RJD25_22465 [Pontibacter sp. G13]